MTRPTPAAQRQTQLLCQTHRSTFYQVWLLFAIFATCLLLPEEQVFAQTPEKPPAAADSTAKKGETAKAADKDKKKKKPKGKAFDEVIEDYEVIEGLFTLYRKADEGKVYMEIKPAQLEQTYLMNITRDGGDGSFFDGGAMLGEFPFKLQRIGERIQVVEINLRFRADNDAAIARAIERDIPNSIRGSAKIASRPHEERGSLLVNASDLFLKDIGNVGSITGRLKLPYSLDKTNSYFSLLKSFPKNTEVGITLHFTSSAARPLFSLANSRSMLHRYRYSIAEVPESNYKPRKSDDRIGHFETLFQDYNSFLSDSPYERYVQRWHLEKAEPRFKLSAPKKPIVFWMENTIPVEYRDAVRRGALMWNSAFEKIGFKDAIVVKQMPDDADWDPADIRFSTIRWILTPGSAYAVGPSRANPFTGELYDADIRFSADFVRFVYGEHTDLVKPASWTKASFSDLLPDMEPDSLLTPEQMEHNCQFASGFAHQVGYGMAMLQARNQLDAAGLEKYINDAIAHVVAHEVGHTLGLRHNFKASSIHTLSEVNNTSHTSKNGLTGSVMDYTPVNIAPLGSPQGDYYQTNLGPYDYWAIEYAYTPYDPDSKDSEKEMLEKIARKVSKAELAYGSDMDAFGFSSRSIDPSCNLWDIGDNPIAFGKSRLDITQDLWKNLSKNFEKDGDMYPRMRSVFDQGIREYAIAALVATKHIGGIYHYRDHIGDPGNRSPMKVVPAAKQREALKLINEYFFSENAFEFSGELLNKLAPERRLDFQSTVYRMFRLDYPIHGIVQLLQISALNRLYDPLILMRMQDNELRFEDDDKFTMPELFSGVRESIWSEVSDGRNVNSFRRELQRMHLFMLDILLIRFPPAFPHDAVTLARADMVKIRTYIKAALEKGGLDTYTEAHLQESLARIDADLEAWKARRF